MIVIIRFVCFKSIFLGWLWKRFIWLKNVLFLSLCDIIFVFWKVFIIGSLIVLRSWCMVVVIFFEDVLFFNNSIGKIVLLIVCVK